MGGWVGGEGGGTLAPPPEEGCPPFSWPPSNSASPRAGCTLPSMRWGWAVLLGVLAVVWVVAVVVGFSALILLVP